MRIAQNYFIMSLAQKSGLIIQLSMTDNKINFDDDLLN